MKIHMKHKNYVCLLSFVIGLLIVLTLPNEGYSQCVDCSNNNVKIGYNNSINNAYQFQSILGNGNTTLRNNAVAIGSESFSRHSHSYVFGSFSESNGIHSYCIGSNSIANTTSSFAIGNFSYSIFGNAFSIGNFVKSNATGGYVFGLGISSSEPLTNPVENSLAIGMKSTKPTLFISESTASSANNLTGKIGIGNVTSPQAKLHIRADEDEDASLFLEPTSTNKSAVIMLGENHQIAARADNDLLFTSSESAGFAFENGSFRVGTAEQPQQISLHGSINAEGLLATAFGEGNSASGNYSFVAGRNSEASKTNAIVIGSYSKATGMHSYVVGSNSFASGDFSYVFGGNSKAEIDFSMAIGNNLRANNGGFVFGMGRVDALLTNNIEKSLVIGFNSAYPTFFVSRTPIDQQSGRIGIGNVTSPQAKLHIRADEGEDASLLLEASAGRQAKLMLSESHEITYEPDENLHFRTAPSKAFEFHQGDIYIEDIQSGIIMRSPNGQCWRGRVNDQGLLAFEQTACPGTETALGEKPFTTSLLKVYPNPADKHLVVETTKITGSFVLTLINLDGKRLMEQQCTAGKTSLNIEKLPAGTYLLLCKQNGQLLDTARILVE